MDLRELQKEPKFLEFGSINLKNIKTGKSYPIKYYGAGENLILRTLAEEAGIYKLYGSVKDTEYPDFRGEFFIDNEFSVD